MKPDKHKSKSRARYKKHHGISNTNAKGRGKGNVVKSQESTESATNVKEDENTKRQSTTFSHKAQIQLEKEKITSSCSWKEYKDFQVDEPCQEPSEPRGEDFQTLVSQQGGASSHMRMKGETWLDGADPLDETTNETSNYFKVDFKEVTTCLQAIPLHQRYGIPIEYFEDDLLELINEDARRHAARIKQTMLDRMGGQEPLTPVIIGFDRPPKVGQQSLNRRDKDGDDNPHKDNVLKLDLENDERSRTVSETDCHVDGSTVKTPCRTDDTSAEQARASRSVSSSDSPRICDTAEKESLATLTGTPAGSSQSTEVHPVQAQSAEAQGGGEVEELEDWLDDII